MKKAEGVPRRLVPPLDTSSKVLLFRSKPERISLNIIFVVHAADLFIETARLKIPNKNIPIDFE